MTINGSIDLRSDTVTKPSPEMWEVLKHLDNSQLGDDVEQEDPLVNALEEKAAKKLGKEAALFVTSGTQGNLLALLSNTSPGEEFLTEEQSHIYKWEVGGAARLAGLMVRTFPSEKGLHDLPYLKTLLRDQSDIHMPLTTLICLENTHNYHGGVVLPESLFRDTSSFAKENNLKIHLDGARLFNAAVATNQPITNFTQYVDTVQICLSKGLCCPIGSILAGPEEFILKARKYRKMVGGGWRQAGILASLGLTALEDTWINRLEEDHKLANLLAENLQSDQLGLRIPTPDTNLVMVHLPNTINLHHFESKLAENGVLAHSMGGRIRLVTHYGLNEDDISRTVKIFHDLTRKML